MKPKHLFCIYENATKDSGKGCPKYKIKFISFDNPTTLHYNGKTVEVDAGKGVKLSVSRNSKVYANTQPMEIKEI